MKPQPIKEPLTLTRSILNMSLKETEEHDFL